MKLKQRWALKYIRTKFKLLAIVSKRKAAAQAFELFCTPFLKTADRAPAIFLTAEKLQFSLNGLLIEGFRWNKSSPHTILILHGFGSAAHNFHPYIQALVDKGYQVLAFDAPAHGHSEGRTVNALQYSFLIEEATKRYGTIHGFVAHSFGGMALSLALERMAHDSQTKVVFIAPATETTTAVDDAFKMLQITNPDIRKAFDQIIFDKSGHTTEWFSISRAIQHLKASILWIHDQDDDITPLKDALVVEEKKYANVQFIITQGLGHRKIYRDRKVLQQVIDFL